mgnify:CR=1 FL=1
MVKKKILIVEGNTREENSEFTAVGINTHTESLIESINFYTVSYTHLRAHET